MPPDKTPVPGSPDDWLIHAMSDLNLARLAREHPEILTAHACFHAQQAAEKAIKAVLLHHGVDFPLVHDLEALVELAQNAGLALPPEVAGVGALTPYAVEARYPILSWAVAAVQTRGDH